MALPTNARTTRAQPLDGENAEGLTLIRIVEGGDRDAGTDAGLQDVSPDSEKPLPHGA